MENQPQPPQPQIKLENDRIISSQELKKELGSLPAQKRFGTGFDTLDKMVAGWRDGDLIILSGSTGAGKTQMAVSFAKSLFDKGINSLFFSYEISTQELFERFGEELPLFYLPRVMTTGVPEWIEKKIIEAKTKYDTKVVFIDHLHYLIDGNTARNRNISEIIGALVREIKAIARRQRLVIVLLCHINRAGTRGERPTINDLRDSSNIGNESDIVMILNRVGKKRSKLEEEAGEQIILANDAILYVDKCRHHGGRLGSIKLEFTEDGFYKEAD